MAPPRAALRANVAGGRVLFHSSQASAPDNGGPSARDVPPPAPPEVAKLNGVVLGEAPPSRHRSSTTARGAAASCCSCEPIWRVGRGVAERWLHDDGTTKRGNGEAVDRLVVRACASAASCGARHWLEANPRFGKTAGARSSSVAGSAARSQVFFGWGRVLERPSQAAALLRSVGFGEDIVKRFRNEEVDYHAPGDEACE